MQKKNWHLYTVIVDLKIKYTKLSIDTFWIAIIREYYSVARKTLLVLIEFSTSYFGDFRQIQKQKRTIVSLSHRRKNEFLSLKYVPILKTFPTNIKRMFLIDDFA